MKIAAICLTILAGTVTGTLSATGAEVDIVVYGATPAGIGAAIVAAREGASVVLLEGGRWIGGVCHETGDSDVICRAGSESRDIRNHVGRGGGESDHR